MNPRSYNIALHQPDKPDGQTSDPLNGIDLDKLGQLAKRNWSWIFVILFVFNSVAFLYIRYTKPLYSSESILKLDIKSEAGLLGIQNPLENDIKGLSGEIEILKSRLFANQVVDAVDMDVSYYHPGRSHLYDERYGNSPFEVSYEIYNSTILNHRFNVEIVDDTSFILDFTFQGVNYRNQYQFGDHINFDFLNLKLTKTDYFENQKNLVEFYFVLNSREALIDYFQKNISVEPVNFNANTIKISLADYNKYKAKSLVQAIDTIYLNYTKSAKNQAVVQKIAFLENQMGKTQKELEAYEDYFEKFTIQNRTTDLSQDLSNTIKLLNLLDSQRFNLRNQLTEVELAMRELKNNQPISTISIPKVYLELIEEYNKLDNERKLKLQSYNENTQVIQQLDQQIEVAKSSALQRLESYQSNLMEAQESLSKRRKILEGNFSELPSMGTSYNKNRRLYSLQEGFYFSLIESKIELEIARAGTVTDFVILSPASMPNEPIKPQKTLIYGAGFLASIIISFFFIAVAYLLDNKISNLKELERLLMAPILGSVPKFRAEKLSLTRLVVSKNPKSSISEALRSIRTNMEFMSSGANGRQLMSVTSTVSGEGKTFIAVNLGAIFAYSGLKVVVIDLDMRKPKVHLAFQDNEDNRGISTILINKNTIDECVKDTEVENLHYIAAGPTPPNPSELILGANFDRMLSDLKSKFDIIMIDTPPVGLVTDGILVMKKVDLPMYVVRSEYSKKSYLKSTHSLIQNNGFDNLSVIFNASSGHGRYGYGYGQGYYDEDVKKGYWLKRIFSRKS